MDNVIVFFAMDRSEYHPLIISNMFHYIDLSIIWPFEFGYRAQHPDSWPGAKPFREFCPYFYFAVLPVSFVLCYKAGRRIFFFFPVFLTGLDGQYAFAHPRIFHSSGSIILEFVIAP